MLAALAVLLSPVCMAQTGTMPANAKLFIDGDQGFAIYLTAAIREKNVNITVTTDRSKADFILEQTSDHLKRTGYKPSIISDWTAPVLPQLVEGNDSASVRLINVKTSEVVFAYSVDRNNTAHGRQTAAESCAKHLKDAVAGGLKSTTGNQHASLRERLAAWPWRPDPAMSF